METPNIIDSRLIPMQQKPLLIPDACIADVVDYSRPSESSLGLDWYLGEISWRGLSIPLISFERLNKGRFAEFSATARIAIMHTTTGNMQQPFYGIVIQGVPQTFQVSSTDIAPATEDPGPAEKLRAHVKEIPVSIPDLALLESHLAKLDRSEAVQAQA